MVTFPLSVHASGRYLVDALGAPFQARGAAVWETPHNLNGTDQASVLSDIAGRGFNAIFVEAVEHKFTSSKPPKDLAGNLPFTKRLDAATYTGSPNGTTTTSGNGCTGVSGGNTYSADAYSNVNTQAPDLTFPDSTYWGIMDTFVAACATSGILACLFPLYYGFNSNDEGWNDEMVANDAVTGAGGFTGQPWADPSKSKVWNYGAWIADRYKGAKNIVWILGGDCGVTNTMSTAQKNALISLYLGAKSIAGQASPLWIAHWDRPSLGSDLTLAGVTFDLESIYANSAAAQWARAGYANSPVQPAIQIENYYEGNATGGTPNRRFNWWSALGSPAGYFFGNEQLWPVTSIWAAQLGSAGALEMAILNGFMAGLPWHKLVPSGLNSMGTLVTSGGGTASPQSTDYVAAAADPGGSQFVAYVPPAHSGGITADLSVMAGGGSICRARWLNPFDGSYRAIGNFPSAAGQAFSPPGDNGSGFSDWVLCVDPAVSLQRPQSALSGGSRSSSRLL